MTTFRLGAFYHDRLNLNGDLMNLRVLAKRLNWREFEVDVVDLSAQNTTDELATGLDFVLIGHGSAAAWASILTVEAGLKSAIKEIMDADVPVLAVASGFELFADFALVPVTYNRSERVSNFAVVESDHGSLLGYLNSDTDLPAFAQFGAVMGTLLHGPFLAKNAFFADHIVDLLISKKLKDGALKKNLVTANVNVQKIDQILVDVWKLESELANE